MVHIDTHQLVKDLVKSGLPQEPSEVLSKAFFGTDSTENLEKEQSNIKTDILLIKSDVSNIKATMATKTDVAEINAKIELTKSDVSNIKATMATKTDVAEIKVDILKWMIPLFITTIGLIITTFFLK